MTYSSKLRLCGLIFAVCVISACASNPPRQVVKVVPVPAELTQPVPEPKLEGETNADLVTWIDRLREALGLANKRLEGISRIKP